MEECEVFHLFDPQNVRSTLDALDTLVLFLILILFVQYYAKVNLVYISNISRCGSVWLPFSLMGYIKIHKLLSLASLKTCASI